MSTGPIQSRFEMTAAEKKCAVRHGGKINYTALISLVLIGTLWLYLFGTDTIDAVTLFHESSWRAFAWMALSYWDTILLTLFLGFIFLKARAQIRTKPPEQRAHRIDEEGILTLLPKTKIMIGWPLFERVIEDADGFFCAAPSVPGFIWISKRGFAVPGEIDLCRAMILKHVENFKFVAVKNKGRK